jgi:acid phosphatase
VIPAKLDLLRSITTKNTKNTKFRGIAAWLFAALVLGVAGCATSRLEPANLGAHKREIRDYVKSGTYAEQLEDVAMQANDWIEQRVARRSGGEQLAVVLDLDETLFLNWSRIDESDFTYVSEDWNRWVEAAAAPAIEPVREVFHKARRNGVAVVFITGRPERQREATEENLRRIGCDDFDALICAPDGLQTSAAEFKVAQRRRIEAEGKTIIANVGDQLSDLIGGHAERVFKLPNPFYLTE